MISSRGSEGFAIIACICFGLNDRTVRKHIREGARSLDELGKACLAGTECEDCQPRLLQLIEEEQTGRPSAS